MAKKTNKKFSTKNIVILTALALALVGYFGYRSLLTSPDINILTPEDSLARFKVLQEKITQTKAKTESSRPGKSEDEKRQKDGNTGFERYNPNSDRYDSK